MNEDAKSKEIVWVSGKDVEFRKLVYRLVTITYIGFWALYLLGGAEEPKKSNTLDVNLKLTGTSLAPVHVQSSNRNY